MEAIVQGEESVEEMMDLLPRSSGSDIADEPLDPDEATDTIDADSPGRFEVRIRPWVARKYVAFEERLAQASKKRPAESSDGALTEDTDDSNESPDEYKPSTTERCLDFVCEAYTCSNLTGLMTPGNEETPQLKQLENFASPDLRKARAHGIQTIMGIMQNPYTPTCLGAFFRDFSVYGLFLLSVSLWINVVAGVIHDQVSEDDREDDPYRVAKLILSTCAMLFAVADLVHHTCAHEYLTCKECTSCEEDSDSKHGACPCPSFCPVAFDGARLFLTELINYPNLLLSIFQLIVETVIKDGKADATTYISVILTSLIALSHVYVARWFVLAGSIFSIQKIRTGDEKFTWRSVIHDRFHVVFVLNAMGHMVIQILMIAAIGTRFSHEYRNFSSTSTYVPSGQLWYMMFFAYVSPLLGVAVFLTTCHIWTQQFLVALVLDILKVLQRPGFVEALESQKTEEEFSITKEMRDSSYLNETELSDEFRKVKDERLFRKLGYPFRNPFPVLLCLLYCGSVIAFWACTRIDGPESAGEIAFYYLAAFYAVFVNGYAFAIASVWVAISVAALFGSIPIVIFFVIVCICKKLPASNTRRNDY